MFQVSKMIYICWWGNLRAHGEMGEDHFALIGGILSEEPSLQIIECIYNYITYEIVKLK